MHRVIHVGLTGGIGSGKSTVAALLAERGAVVIDADRLARDVVAPGTDGIRRVVGEFGEAVLAPDGALDRSRLASVVFADPARRAALNAIVHPLVRSRSDEIVAGLPPDAVVVHDIPLLVENGMASRFDLVVVVDAPDEVQVERLVRDRGLEPDDARARIAAQATREQRRAVADFVIDNSGPPEGLTTQVRELWSRVEQLSGGP